MTQSEIKSLLEVHQDGAAVRDGRYLHFIGLRKAQTSTAGGSEGFLVRRTGERQNSVSKRAIDIRWTEPVYGLGNLAFVQPPKLPSERIPSGAKAWIASR